MKNAKDSLINQIEKINGDTVILTEDIKDFLEGFNTIQTPLGLVEYRVTGSLKLVEFMESIEEQIRAL